MARIRTIKPEFFTSEDIVELEPLARLLYIAIWCEADKEGRMAWKPKTFKMRYLPGDSCDIDAICDALVTRGLVILYGDGLAFIPSFKAHQHINPREKDSGLPSPSVEELTRQPRVSDASVTRREEGRKEGNTKDASIPSPPPAAPSFNPSIVLISLGVSAQTAKDWLQLRKSKRAPVSETALTAIVRESEKAKMTLNQALEISCKRGWTGFEAHWVKPDDLLSVANGRLEKDWE